MSDKAKIPTAYEFLKELKTIPYNHLEDTIKTMNEYAKLLLSAQVEYIKEKAKVERKTKYPGTQYSEINYLVDKSAIEEAHQNFLKENNLLTN